MQELLARFDELGQLGEKVRHKVITIDRLGIAHRLVARDKFVLLFCA